MRIAIIGLAMVLAGPAVGGEIEQNAAIQNKMTLEWSGCVTAFAEGAARRTNEPAAVIVDGSFAACQSYEDNLFLFYKKVMGSPDFGLSIMPAVRDNIRKETVARVLLVRSAPAAQPAPKKQQPADSL